jgi:hypothetical protein
MLPVSRLARRPSVELQRHIRDAYSPTSPHGGRVSDWGICMTVCIGGICQYSSIIATVSDRMAVWGHGGSDQPLLKAVRLAPLWVALMAGDDITRGVEDVIRETRTTLKEYGDRHSVQQIRATIVSTWRDAQNARGAAAVLNPFAMTVRQFMKVGPTIFSSDRFNELALRLQEESRLESQLLICGFNEHGVPWLFAYDDDSPWHDFTRGGYIAIGCAAPVALSSLANQGYKRENDLRTAIYQLCVAKFAAESDQHVGRDTLVMCLRDDGHTCWITPGNINNRIRRLWERNKIAMPDESDLARIIDPLVSASQWRDDI